MRAFEQPVSASYKMYFTATQGDSDSVARIAAVSNDASGSASQTETFSAFANFCTLADEGRAAADSVHGATTRRSNVTSAKVTRSVRDPVDRNGTSLASKRAAASLRVRLAFETDWPSSRSLRS
mgnify:CR=1 FL=1